MKALIIGGTGTISRSITELLIKTGWDVYILNRGNRELPEGAKQLIGDVNDEESIRQAVKELTFDVVANFLAYYEKDAERDFRVFNGITGQYIFISSASAYQKPARTPYITESTPLINPYWQYSRDKAAAERYLLNLHTDEAFPATIVRPSHTYDKQSIPITVCGDNGPWQILNRMINGKEILIHGDGTSLWTVTNSRDFAKGFVGLMGNIHAIGHAVHITSDEILSWNQIYEEIANALGVPFKPFYATSTYIIEAGSKYGYDFCGALLGDKSPSVIFDNSKLKRLVPGFTASIRYDIGIKESVEYFLSHKEMQKEDPKFDRFCDELILSLKTAIKSFS